MLRRPPRKISDGWNGLPADFQQGHWSAALNGGGPFSGFAYFFKGSQYVKYNWFTDQAESVEPRDIEKNWLGLLKWGRTHRCPKIWRPLARGSAALRS